MLRLVARESIVTQEEHACLGELCCLGRALPHNRPLLLRMALLLEASVVARDEHPKTKFVFTNKFNSKFEENRP